MYYLLFNLNGSSSITNDPLFVLQFFKQSLTTSKNIHAFSYVKSISEPLKTVNIFSTKTSPLIRPCCVLFDFISVFIIITLFLRRYSYYVSIQSDTIWNATKKRAKVIGKVSLSALAQGAKFLTDLWMSNPDKFNEIVNQADNFIK